MTDLNKKLERLIEGNKNPWYYKILARILSHENSDEALAKFLWRFNNVFYPTSDSDVNNEPAPIDITELEDTAPKPPVIPAKKTISKASPDVLTPAEVQIQAQPNKPKKNYIPLITVVALASVIGGYFLLTNQITAYNASKPTPQPTMTLIPMPTKTIDELCNAFTSSRLSYLANPDKIDNPTINYRAGQIINLVGYYASLIGGPPVLLDTTSQDQLKDINIRDLKAASSWIIKHNKAPGQIPFDKLGYTLRNYICKE